LVSSWAKQLASGELSEAATIRKIRIVQEEGKRPVTREVDFYNLDAIIAVGYRVNSRQSPPCGCFPALRATINLPSRSEGKIKDKTFGKQYSTGRKAWATGEKGGEVF
jgi:hypothetical protein